MLSNRSAVIINRKLLYLIAWLDLQIKLFKTYYIYVLSKYSTRYILIPYFLKVNVPACTNLITV